MDIVIRSVIAFAALWLIARASGRATLGELSSFDLLVFITMGDLIQQGVTGDDRTLTGGLLAVGTFALFAVLLNVVTARWPAFGRTLEGSPIVLIAHGRPRANALKRQRIAMPELMSAARQSGFESLQHVRLAVLEQDGKLSFFREPESSEAD